MPLADTSKAIGAVTKVLKERLESARGVGKPVSIGRLDQSTGTDAHVNLFLYEILFDPHLKNTPLNEGEKPPAWLVLKYLLTAFESTKESDSADAHELLGKAIRVIQKDDLLKLDGLAADTAPLTPNPSELHVTFDESPSDLVAKLTQGTDETPRLSIAFQVRPVMIASGEPGDYSLLVGVDYSKPPVALQRDYVGLDVIPSMGPVIERISAIRTVNGIESETGNGFELGEEVAVFGSDMHLANLSVMIGSVELPVTMQTPSELRFKVNDTIIFANGISAGSYPVTVVLTLPETGKKRKSNAVMGNLVPTLSSAIVTPIPPGSPPGTPDNLTIIPEILGPPKIPKKAFAKIDLAGKLLGSYEDDVILAFYKDGKVQVMFDVFSSPVAPPPPVVPGQLSRQLTMTAANAVIAGDYNMILIVNGQQAPQSPIVHLDKP